MPDSTTFTPAEKAALRERFAREDYDHKLECYARQVERLFEQGDEEEFGRRVRASRRNGGKVFQRLYENAKRYELVQRPSRMPHRVPGLYNALVYAVGEEKLAISLAKAKLPQKREAMTPEERRARRRQLRNHKKAANVKRLTPEQLRERGYRYAGAVGNCSVHERPGDDGWMNVRLDWPGRRRKQSFWLAWSVTERRWSKAKDSYTLSRYEPETLVRLAKFMDGRWGVLA